MRLVHVWALAMVCALGHGPLAQAAAAAPAPLQRFLDGLSTYRAQFEQQVEDAHGQPVDTGRGTLWVQRPGHFRWDYQPAAAAGSGPSGQQLITDGRNLWLYERDLAQATVRDAASVEAATPMLLLSGDAAALDSAFTLVSEADHDGLQWVEVRPRGTSADFARAELGFRGTVLARMIISDKLGQVTTLRITDSQRNPRLDGGFFSFTPPKGVDVIGTPRT